MTKQSRHNKNIVFVKKEEIKEEVPKDKKTAFKYIKF